MAPIPPCVLENYPKIIVRHGENIKKKSHREVQKFKCNYIYIKPEL